MMLASGHTHLGHEQHHDTSKLGDHVIYNDQVCTTNYIEPENSLITTNNTTMMIANQQTRQESNPLSVCLQQPYGTFNNNCTPTTGAQPSQQNQTSGHEQWPMPPTPGGCGSGQWSGNHKFYIAHNHHYQNICQKQTQTSNGTFYDYLQTKFTPIANYNDNSRIPPDSAKPDSQYQATVSDQHYYISNMSNQGHTTNYNVDDYNSIQPRAYLADTSSHSRYTQTAYQDNQTVAFNQTATSSVNESQLMYQHCQQNYTSPLKATDANRVPFVEGEGRVRQSADQASPWANHQYQDYAGPVMSHQQQHHQPGLNETNFAQQTNSWLDKTGARIQYHQNHDSTYGYYRPPAPTPQLLPTAQPPNHCPSTQTYPANQTDPTRAQISTHRLPPLPATDTNYNSAEPFARLALAVSDNIELQQPDGQQEPIETSVVKSESKLRFRQTSPGVQSVSSRKQSSIVQLTKKCDEFKDKRLGQVPIDATSSSNNQNASQSDRLNQCRICGRHYARPSTLKTHLRTHTNERPYKCAVCCKTFSQAANLTAHQRVHTGERPFPCPICGRQFSQSSSVITHLRTHSGERPYRCNMCNRTFSDSSTLTKHCRIHSGEKPYQCEYCPMNFSQSGNLSRHLRLHSIGGSNKTQPTTATAPSVASSTSAAAVVVVASTTTSSSTNQRKHLSNPSSSPESTLSSYSMSSRISSGASNSTSSSSSG